MARPIDLLITDYHLRDHETGLDVIRAVRAQLRTSVPVILVSESPSSTSSRSLGVVDFAVGGGVPTRSSRWAVGGEGSPN